VQQQERTPHVHVQIVQSDNSVLTQYKPPEPVIKIMKRPSSTSSELNSLEGDAKPKPKTLKQRETEYAQARLRILGSSGSPESGEAAAANGQKVVQAEVRPVVSNVVPPSGNSVVRTPRGPDGTKGFQAARE
jgi:hypothetical protein